MISNSTNIQIVRSAALLLLLTGCTVTRAWVSPVSVRNGVAANRMPALGMFDWFNPKPKVAEPEKPKEEPKPEPVAATPVAVEEPAPAPAPVEEPVPAPEPVAATPVPAPVEEPVAAAAAPEAAVHSGKVKWYNPRKGFGFLLDSTDSKEIFVHQSQIQAEGFRILLDGEAVEFQVHEDEQGRFKASHVTGPNGGDLKITLRRKRKEEGNNNDQTQ